ncbi:UDP-glucose/GDP-mannose dehydrogenase family protein [bacterium]|nr:UDP-glucose/GDP-mannose dehydrogenase family protein [bacterium]
MNISVIGTGYVGLVAGAGLADFGHNILCMDTDKKKIENLKKGVLPIYEPGLDTLVERDVKNSRLSFTTDIEKTITASDIIFIAVGTPPKDDGSADLSSVLAVAKEVGRRMNGYKVVVNKSTVPVGTAHLVQGVIQSELDARNVEISFDVVSNPEFLREGKSVYDFLNPNRIVIGSTTEKAKELMQKVYRVLHVNQTPFVFTNPETAELIKYASNAFLAVKISFINEMALLADKVGANVQNVAKAMGMDGRISSKFLHAGPGYGGSCFPKDTKALVDIAKKQGEEMLVVSAAIAANDKQKKRMVTKIVDKMGNVEGKTISILGLSFKPETDDMRDSPALDIIPSLVERGAKIRAFCPQGMRESEWRLASVKDAITYCSDSYDAATGSDAVVVLTEWNQFRGLDLQQLRTAMNGEYFFDFRNIYSRDNEIQQIFSYEGVGIS